MSKYLKNWLLLDTKYTAGGYEWKVILTRTSDITLSLKYRTQFANSKKVNRFISIHQNSSKSATSNGSETYHKLTSPNSHSVDLAKLAQEEIISHGKLKSRGVKKKDFYVLKHTSMPGILVEPAFISNANEKALIRNNSWKNNIAKGLLHALQRHYNKKAYTPQKTFIVDNSNSGFNASSNWKTASASSDKYKSNYRYIDAVLYSPDPAYWEVNLPVDGKYKVYAWWPAASNRTANACYVVQHYTFMDFVNADQRYNGGKWNLLGVYDLKKGTNMVQLLSNGVDGKRTVADAIKWQKQ